MLRVRSLALAALASTGLAAAFPFETNLFPRDACAGNTATTRGEWCDFSIDTDYTTTGPSTGVTREYWFEITDMTLSPDGVPRAVMAINGTIPGPTITANWGDTVVVHVSNQLVTSQNGTSIHFHGIRQNYTNANDGVNAITQCPTAPGESITYTWKACQYGTTWYHSHTGLQAWEGVAGAIVINGPATSNYEEDMGVVFLSDWTHRTVDEIYEQAETSGPPTLDNGLLNGMNVYGDDGDASQTGYRYNVSVTEGSSYRFRLINGAIDTHYKFSVDNHTVMVIASDLIPITPFETTVLNIGMGQRYDIILTADQASVASSFWMRAIPQSACSDNAQADNIRGILYYGSSTDTPTTSAWSYTDGCNDETANLSPYISKTVESAEWTALEQASVSKNTAGLFKWTLNSTSMLVDWTDPTLLGVLNNETAWETSEAVLTLDEASTWVHFVVETTLGVPHPIHLHGHDFFVLAQGSGTYDADSTSLNLSNPPRRDTAMLPSSGYLVMAWETDNPGVWLMHCHIGWHTAEGFAVQFVERASEITAMVGADTQSGLVGENCDAWASYQGKNTGVVQEDSGI